MFSNKQEELSEARGLIRTRVWTGDKGDFPNMKMRSAILSTFTISVCAMVGVSISTVVAAENAQKPGNAAGRGWSAEVAGGGSQSVSLDANQTKTVEKVNEYFNAMKTLKGRFVQTAADGEVLKGKFKMKRPGMFRFDYSRPSRQVVVSDGTYLAIQDHDLENEDRVALDHTPFRVLLRSDVNLLRDALITEVQENDGSLMLGIRDKSPDTPGKIRLLLEKEGGLQLKEWITTDAQGLDTKVQVARVVKDAEIDASEFVIVAPGNPFQQ